MYRPHTLLARLRSGAKRLVISMTLELAAVLEHYTRHTQGTYRTRTSV